MIDPATHFLVYHEMIRRGIVPFMEPKVDMCRFLSQLPPEEGRIARRKFRKSWRKIAWGRKSLHKRELGLGILNPGRGKKINRKYYVYYDVLQDIFFRKNEHFRTSG